MGERINSHFHIHRWMLEIVYCQGFFSHKLNLSLRNGGEGWGNAVLNEKFSFASAKKCFLEALSALFPDFAESLLKIKVKHNFFSKNKMPAIKVYSSNPELSVVVADSDPNQVIFDGLLGFYNGVIDKLLREKGE